MKSAHVHTTANTVFDGPISNLLPTLHFDDDGDHLFHLLMRRAGVAGQGKAVMISNLALLLVFFRVTAGHAWQ